jgi:geranylgeranyl diphosphate synthase type II
VTAPVELTARLGELKQAVDRALDRLLPAESGPAARLARAMRYAVFAGGKRLRPALVLECCGAAGGRPEDAMAAACAVEMIHAYSLVHDDLPAMDDDDLRRGKPSLHRAFDEATAVLAGDALLALAFETALKTGPPAVALEVTRTLARAAGPERLVAGQLIDMTLEGSRATLADIEDVHVRKTAALVEASCRAGALIARDGPDEAVEALSRYGRALGRAFQIADDILDATSTPEELGKTPGKDAAAGKATYPAVAGLDGARARAGQLADEAAAALDGFGERAEFLRALARFVVERES